MLEQIKTLIRGVELYEAICRLYVNESRIFGTSISIDVLKKGPVEIIALTTMQLSPLRLIIRREGAAIDITLVEL